jgi:hypothetical protein
MFIFGHLGISLGAASLVSGAISHLSRSSNSETQPSPENKSLLDRIGFRTLSRFLDIRLFMLGSLTPDIIDKPLAFFGFGGGRSITHTLLIFLIFSGIGLIIYLSHRSTWLLAIALGIFTHLVLDFMWADPEILFWPLQGWIFPHPVRSLGFSQIGIWLNTLLTNPEVILSESAGLAILLGIGWLLANQALLKSFLQKGKS